VTLTVSGAHKGQTFVIGYAASGTFPTQCLQDFAPIPNAPTLTIGDGGSATTTVSWPADSGTGSFYLCARDAGNPLNVLQSDHPFNVDSTKSPSITVQPAPQPTPTPGGQPTATPSLPDGTYVTGENVVVNGTSFLPGGTSVQIYLSSTPNGQGTQISIAPVNADTTGAFSTTVTLPDFRTGNLYIQAATPDGTNAQGGNYMPSLLASTAITIALAPTPTPTPTATVSPTSTTPSNNTGTGSGNGDTVRILGVAGLGSLSVLLLLIGAALLVSAGTRGKS
jgi:hypothetical protein